MSSLRINSRSRVELISAVELAEQGKFFYDDFRQQLALSWQNQDVDLLVRNRIASGLVVSVGGKLFHQTRWNHRLSSDGRPERRLRDRHTNIGPILELFYNPSPTLELTFVGNLLVVYSSQRDTEHINRFDLNLNWFF
jgi:hypothetical protein